MVAVARCAEILIQLHTMAKKIIKLIKYITIEIFFKWNYKLAIVAIGRFAETLIPCKPLVGRKDETFW